MEPLVKRQRTGLTRLFHLPSLSQQSALRVSRKRGEASSSDDYSDFVEILEACPELQNAKDGLTLRQKISYFEAVKKYQLNSGKFANFAEHLFCEIPTTGYNVGEDLSDCLEVFCDYVEECDDTRSDLWNLCSDMTETVKILNLAPCVRSVTDVPLYSLNELQKRNILRFLTRLRAPEEVTFKFLTRKTQWHPIVAWISFKDFITDPCGAVVSCAVACCIGVFFFAYLVCAPTLHNHIQKQATSIQARK